jgi:hypothetical protein
MWRSFGRSDILNRYTSRHRRHYLKFHGSLADQKARIIFPFRLLRQLVRTRRNGDLMDIT